MATKQSIAAARAVRAGLAESSPKPTSKAKIIQIAVAAREGTEALYALDSDGNIWTDNGKNYGDWGRVPLPHDPR